jgi:hypothetical protein
MESTYSIYRQLPGNTLAWVERVNGLQQAEESVGRWAQGFPGNYIIFDVRERTVVWAGNALQQFAIPGLEAIIAGKKAADELLRSEEHLPNLGPFQATPS